MTDKELLPSKWIRDRVKFYWETGEAKSLEEAHNHAIMDYLDAAYKEKDL